MSCEHLVLKKGKVSKIKKRKHCMERTAKTHNDEWAWKRYKENQSACKRNLEFGYGLCCHKSFSLSDIHTTVNAQSMTGLHDNRESTINHIRSAAVNTRFGETGDVNIPVQDECRREKFCPRLISRCSVPPACNEEGVSGAQTSRPLSAPGFAMVAHRHCHCVACCSCSPTNRCSSACTAFEFPPQSTCSVMRRASSLDRRRTSRHVMSCDAGRPCSRSPAAVIHKSSSLPLCCSAHLKYYSVGISFDLPSNGVLPHVGDLTGHGTACCISPPPVDCSSAPLSDESSPCMSASHSSECNTVAPASPSARKTKIQATEYREKLDTVKTWFEEFDHEQRNLFLADLLALCGQPQIHYLSVKMAPQMHAGCPLNCEDRLGWLPEAMSFKILSYLDPASLCQCLLVCQRWYELACEPSLWRQLCSLAKWRLSRSSEQKQFARFLLHDGRTDWRGVFAERFRLQNNWLRGRCNVRTFEGHTQGISCVQFDDTRIVSGSSDKTIKLWNIRTNSPWAVQTLVGHSGTVRCLHLEGNRLVSGSMDCTIKVWDLSSQESWTSIACKVTMVGHTETVRCLQVDDDKVVSGSYDKTLKIWNIKTGVCRNTLRGHAAAVLCVQFDNEKIISGSCDKTIKVWTFDGTCLVTLEGHQDAVTCLRFDNTRIVSGSIDCTLRFWDLQSRRSIKVIDWKASEGHTGVVRCLQVDSWRVVSASDDRTIKVWSLESGQRLVTLRNHTDGVTCLQFSDAIIVSGSYDKTVKLWDFSCC